MASILDFDAVSEAEAATPLLLTNADGSDSPLTVMVVGDQAADVQRFVQRVMRDRSIAEARAEKAGKAVEFDLERIKEQNVEGAAVRVTGWSGVTEAYSRDLFKAALRRNPHWVAQIVAHSGDAANFTKRA